MVSISQALETAVAVIVLVVLIVVFFKMFGTTECDGFANTTAIDITNAINQVALEDDVLQWTKIGSPSDADTDYYKSVPIRLCEKSPIESFMSLFSAQSPTYIVTYGQFPQEGFAWSEAQPFSGGAVQSILSYSVMKYGIRGINWFSHYGTKFVKIVGTGTKRVISYMMTDFKIQRISKSWNDFMNNRVFEAIKRNLIRSTELADDIKKSEDIINPSFFTKENQEGFLSKINDKIAKENMDKQEALLESVVAKGEDGKLKQIVINGEKKYVVTSDAKSFIENYKAVASPDEKVFLDTLYVEPKFSSLSQKIAEFKATKWVPFKKWVVDSRLKRYTYDVASSVYKKVTGKIQGAKNKFNTIFNFKESMLDSENLAIQTGNLKKIALRPENRKVLRNDLIEKIVEDPNFKAEMERLAGKALINVEDISDELIASYVTKITRTQALKELAALMPRDLDNVNELAERASTKIGKDIKTEIDEISGLLDSNPSAAREKFTALQDKYRKPWSSLTDEERRALRIELSKGYKINGESDYISSSSAREVYEFARLMMQENGLFSSDIPTKQLIGKAQKVQNDLFTVSFRQSEKYSDSSVIDYFNRPIIDGDNLDQMAARQAATYLWQRTKRGVLLDLNRIGQGYDPITGSVPISFAPFNPIPGAYSIKKALNQETQGCTDGELCKITRGVAQGAVETATSYPFDEAVQSGLQVKLWRPKPELTDRFPVGVGTALLYSSVSGCSDPSKCPDQSPNFYVVSPCFATAKIWKSSDGTVFVGLEKEKKCDVSSCEQTEISINLTVPQMTVPFIGIQTPSFNFGTMPLNPSSVDTPNYCYADEEYIWGEEDSPSTIAYAAEYTACVGGCAAALGISSAGTALGPAIRMCLKPCSYVAIGTLFVETLAATQSYRDVPSWERQSEGWGYWNYQKAADICDDIDAIASFAGTGGAAKKAVSTLQKVGSKVGIGINELCYGLQVIGDSSLAWPIKTPQPDFWRKSTTLNEQCMKDSAEKCVWLEKCDEYNPCDAGWSCIDNTCKKVG